MGAPYSSTSVSGYNSNPPADDGSQVEANRVKWSTIKTKLSDPLNTFASAVNTAISAAFGKIMGGAGIVSYSSSSEVSSADQGKFVRATQASITITTPDATGVGAPFVFGFLNNSNGNVTVDGNGSQTIDGQTSITVPTGCGTVFNTDGSNWFTTGQNWNSALPRGYIDGCTGANNSGDATNDIDIVAGVCRDSTNAFSITCAAMTKQLDANWVAGTNQGMRNSAASIANTTYHIYAVAKADGTQDYYAHTSAVAATVLTALQAETGGSAYLYVRRIFSIIRSGGAILPFVQFGDEFMHKATIQSINGFTTTSETLSALSVPAGIIVEAIVQAALVVPQVGGAAFLKNPSMTDVVNAPTLSSGSATIAAFANVASTEITCQARVWTNASSQVYARVTSSCTLYVHTLGWTDQRGKNA